MLSKTLQKMPGLLLRCCARSVRTIWVSRKKMWMPHNHTVWVSNSLGVLLLCCAWTAGAAPDPDFYTALSAYDMRNYHKALFLFRKSAQRGNPEAQYNLGVMYLYGRGVAADADRARRWLRRAAASGHAQAAYSLGRLLIDRRRGRFSDQRKAAYWFRLAAKYGSPDAMYWLGNMYTMGRGVALNRRSAAHWYRKAAELGHRDAQLHLGRLYAAGNGVPRNLVRAYAWTEVAHRQGHRHAGISLHHLRRRLNSTQLASAQRLATRLYTRASAAARRHLSTQGR